MLEKTVFITSHNIYHVLNELATYITVNYLAYLFLCTLAYHLFYYANITELPKLIMVTVEIMSLYRMI